MTSVEFADEAGAAVTLSHRIEVTAPAILVIDDDAGLRLLLERCLTAFGYRALLAHDGEEALRIAGATPEIRLIMLDLVMPGLSGRALLEQLTALLPDAAILVCSGHPATALAALEVDIEAAQFMQKPCRPAELQKRLSEMLAVR